MKKCLSCDKSIEDNAEFCTFCGKKQSTIKVDKKIKKSKKKRVFIGLSLLVLILLTGFGYSRYQNENAKNNIAVLFDSNNALNKNIKQKKLDDVTKVVNQVIDPKAKKSFKKDIKIATSMFKVVEGSKNVLNNKNILNEGVTTKELDSIKENLEKVSSFSPIFYDKYNNIYLSAQQQYELYSNVKNEIESVYNNGDIKEDISRDVYEKLSSMNETIKNNNIKESFSTKLNKIEEIILLSEKNNARIEEEKIAEKERIEEENRKNTTNLTDEELSSKIMAYYYKKSDITDDAVKSKFDVTFEPSPNDGYFMYINPETGTGIHKGSYTLTEDGDFQLMVAPFGEVDPQYNGNIFDDLFTESNKGTPKLTESSFIGDWSFENLFVSITTEKVIVGLQQSGNATLGEILEQSFDNKTNILTISIYIVPDLLNVTPENQYIDLIFGIKEVNGYIYLVYEGNDYEYEGDDFISKG